VDVHVDDDTFIIEAAVPGLSVDDLKIEILDDVVTLSAEVETEENGSKETLLDEIRRSGQFSRRLRLPVPVDPTQAEAKVENGLLTVRIPKAEEARPKIIEVKAK
jgi:HSP20 family protein